MQSVSIYSTICKYTTSQTFMVSKIFFASFTKMFVLRNLYFYSASLHKIVKSDSKGMLVIHAVLSNFLFWTVLNIDNNLKDVLSTKSTYYNYFRIMWHWRLEIQLCLYINYILKLIIKVGKLKKNIFIFGIFAFITTVQCRADRKQRERRRDLERPGFELGTPVTQQCYVSALPSAH